MKKAGRRVEKSVLRALIFGAVTAVAAELVIAAILAAITLGGTLSEKSMPAAAIICAFVCAAGGGLLGAIRSPGMKLPVALGVGSALLAVNFTAGRLLEAQGSAPDWRIAAAAGAGALLAGILAAGRRNGTHRRTRARSVH